MFKTARFKLHNPSRHKQALLSYALQHYHLTLKRILESALADPDLGSKITAIGKNGKPRVDKAALSRLTYKLAPKDWPLAPLRDYLIGDVMAMLMSHFEKLLKGKNESNPPTLTGLQPMTEEERQAALQMFSLTIFGPDAEQQEEIAEVVAAGHVRQAAKLNRVLSAVAERKAMGSLLRSLEVPLPRPIEVTRHEFARGFMLAAKGNNVYLLVRLFSRASRRWSQVKLDDGFINWKTKEPIGGKNYPGLVLPLEFGRQYHELEFLKHGKPQSAKLILKRTDKGEEEFYVHIAFEFKAEPIVTTTFLGIDRGSVKIGTASIIDQSGRLVAEKLELDGRFFNQQLREFEQRIEELQRQGAKRPRQFRLRKRWANIAIGEYANRVVAAALEHHSQVVLEKIDARAMRGFLSRSQFQKLHAMLDYKCERVGLPKPIEVPAAYTSQTCARCGHKDPANRPKQDAAGKPLQNVFCCLACGHQANADDNASQVIAMRALHQVLHGGRFQKFADFQQWFREQRREVKSASPCQ